MSRGSRRGGIKACVCPHNGLRLSHSSPRGGTQLPVTWHMVPVHHSLEANTLVLRVSLGADSSTHTAP